MEMAMLMLPLMLYLMLPAPSMESRQSSIPLSMMDQSVDDRYDGCTEKMAKKVKDKYLKREMKNNSLFKSAWKKAESFAKNKYKTRKNKALTIYHLQAICAYTANDVYEPFNTAVRTGRPTYATPAFQYHTLHYWLVSALEILRLNKSCRITYRRSKEVFTGNVNQMIRFGTFASSSKKANLHNFGKVTCFHIRTCYAGSLEDYSVYKSEAEVLIPPYETFKIMEIAKGSYMNMTDCNTVFVLKNAGQLSNLNCKAARTWRPIIDN